MMLLKPENQVSIIALDPIHLTKLRDLLKELLPQKQVLAYGSRVKGTATKRSDLDCIVRDARPIDVANANDVLMDSELPFIVQLFSWEEIPESFHQAIAQCYYVLQESN
jgi:uncharacterized protein